MLAQTHAYLNLHSAYERKHGICASESYTFICICYMSVCTKGVAVIEESLGHSDQTVFGERPYLKNKTVSNQWLLLQFGCPLKSHVLAKPISHM